MHPIRGVGGAGVSDFDDRLELVLGRMACTSDFGGVRITDRLFSK
jgi:hypothetical protein